MAARCNTDNRDDTTQDTSTSALCTILELKRVAKSYCRYAKAIVAAHRATADPQHDASYRQVATSSTAHGGAEVVRSETRKNGREGGDAGERLYKG